MSTGLVALVAVGVACCGWIFLHRRKAKTRHSSRQTNQSFAGVAIVSEEDAPGCAAMRAIEGKRFLSHDAPILPLADCDATKCCCRYVRYSDRRDGDERRALVGSGTITANMEDRRKVGRRVEDREEDISF